MSEAINSVGNEIQMDKTAINDIANSTVPESKIARILSAARPELRFHGETPIRNAKELDTLFAKSAKGAVLFFDANAKFRGQFREESRIKH